MKKFLTFALLGMCLFSCAPSTPLARIQKSPEKFEALSPQQKRLVEAGQVERGMPPDAVYLAWGPPSHVFQGSSGRQVTERWDYSSSRPVFTNTFHGSYGRFCGPSSRFGCSGAGWGPDVVYIPYRVGSVWFIDNQVDSWERAR